MVKNPYNEIYKRIEVTDSHDLVLSVRRGLFSQDAQGRLYISIGYWDCP